MQRAMACSGLARLVVLAVAASSWALGAALAAEGSAGPRALDWPVMTGDVAATRFSPADEITADNLGELEIAWSWASKELEIASGFDHLLRQFQGTPIMAGGRVIIRDNLGRIAALDPARGTELWVFDPESYKRELPEGRIYASRGVAHWEDPEGRARIIHITDDRRLMALDAATGQPVTAFGEGGMVDLDASVRRGDPKAISYKNGPFLAGGVILVGGIIGDNVQLFLDRENPMARPELPSGDVRAFDAGSGRLLWTFRTVPGEGEAGVETWEEESWRWTGHANVWTLMSADPALGLAFLPVSSPSFDVYGGLRKGDNLFGQSIVAVELRTGRRAWHFQTVHHPLWDYDPPAPPMLADLKIDGRQRKILALPAKTGFLYVLDRATGEPIWPVEERAVPASSLPGERSSPTQPFPTKPPSFARQGVGPEDLLSLTPELAAKAREVAAAYEFGPLFTPSSLRGVLAMPNSQGGANWSSAALDPEKGVAYVIAYNRIQYYRLRTDDHLWGYANFWGVPAVEGLPLNDPPWTTLTAIDLKAGTILWQVPQGDGPRRHPAIAHLDLPPLGSLNPGSELVTREVVFTLSSEYETYGPAPAPKVRAAASLAPEVLAELKLDGSANLTAYDKASGARLWSHPVGPEVRARPAPPITYVHEGRQFVVVATGGRPARLIAFARREAP